MRNLFNLHAEGEIIASLFYEPHRRAEFDELTPDDFHDRDYANLYAAFCEHGDSGIPFCAATIAENAKFDLITLSNLMRNAIPNCHLEGRIAMLKLHRRERDLYAAAVRIQDELTSEENHHDALDKAESVVSEITTASVNQAETGLVDMRDAVRDYYDYLTWRHNHQGIHGLTTGLSELDTRFQGWKAGDLVILAARPSMGKTTMALQIAAHNGLDGKRTLVFSLEMPRRQLVQRLFSSVGQIPLRGLKDASVLDDPEHTLKIYPTADRLIRSAVMIDDTGGLDIADLRRRARQAHRQQKVDLVVIDYLQLMNDRTEKDRFQVVSAVSRKLKALAKELDCVVLALSQLSRKCEERSDKRPINADLRESGQIEQDADIISFIYRDEIYNADGPKGVAELITSKFRDGEIGTDMLEFIGYQNRFKDLEHQPQMPARQSGGFDY